VLQCYGAQWGPYQPPPPPSHSDKCGVVIICGSDGVTYYNICDFKTAQVFNPILRSVHSGPCRSSPQQNNYPSTDSSEWSPYYNNVRQNEKLYSDPRYYKPYASSKEYQRSGLYSSDPGYNTPYASSKEYQRSGLYSSDPSYYTPYASSKEYQRSGLYSSDSRYYTPYASSKQYQRSGLYSPVPYSPYAPYAPPPQVPYSPYLPYSPYAPVAYPPPKEPESPLYLKGAIDPGAMFNTIFKG
jgi:hypothetical protein